MVNKITMKKKTDTGYVVEYPRTSLDQVIDENTNKNIQELLDRKGEVKSVNGELPDTNGNVTITIDSDVITLNDTVTSTSTTEASTARATKEAYDKGVEALTLANNNTYTLPTATNTVLGGVKTGVNIINTSGTISVADGSTTVKGLVQLNDTVTSVSTALGATANSVKQAFDKGNEALALATTANNKVFTKGDVGLGNVDNVKQMPISGGTLENYSEKITTLTSGVIDLSQSNVFTHTLTANTTYSITGAVPNVAHSFTLFITQGSTARTITFPSSVKWQTIPDLSIVSKTYILSFVTRDGGNVWYGVLGGIY